jgi:hypothetical protein
MKAVPQSDKMQVQFGFFEGDRLLHKGGFLIKSAKAYFCYGEHKHIEYSLRTEETPLGVQLFSGLIFETQFEFPACPVALKFLEIVPSSDPLEPFVQKMTLNAALRMGVHQSEDGESIELGRNTLAFKCSI